RETVLDLVDVQHVVVVGVVIEIVGDEISVRVEAALDLDRVGDGVVVGVGVDEVGDAVAVGIDRTGRGIFVAGLEAIADAVFIGIRVKVVGRAVVVGVAIGRTLVGVVDRVTIGVFARVGR